MVNLRSVNSHKTQREVLWVRVENCKAVCLLFENRAVIGVEVIESRATGAAYEEMDSFFGLFFLQIMIMAIQVNVNVTLL
jgi:hypothetical protein